MNPQKKKDQDEMTIEFLSFITGLYRPTDRELLQRELTRAAHLAGVDGEAIKYLMIQAFTWSRVEYYSPRRAALMAWAVMTAISRHPGPKLCIPGLGIVGVPADDDQDLLNDFTPTTTH